MVSSHCAYADVLAALDQQESGARRDRCAAQKSRCNQDLCQVTADDMVKLIATLANPTNTVPQGNFTEPSRETLKLIPTSDKGALATVNYRLGDRDRGLR